MKYTSRALRLALAFSSLNTPAVAVSANPTGCLAPNEVDLAIDYFPDKVAADFSEYWSVEYANTYKIATNKASNETYLLYQCGTEPPADQMDGRHAAVLSVPLRAGVGVTTTPKIAYFETLGLGQEIIAFIGWASYVSSQCVVDGIQQDRIAKLGLPLNETEFNMKNFSSDFVIFKSPGENFTGIANAVSLAEFEEESNAAISEWIEYYSLFFNREAAATDFMDNALARYECGTKNAMLLTTDAPQKRRTVLWGFYSDFCSGWDVGECPNYYCEYAQACSADLLNTTEGSIATEKCGIDNKYMTFDEFVALGKDADVWIYPGPNFNDVLAKNTDVLNTFVSVQNKEVYDFQGSGENAWFEQRFVELDVVLQDFCSVVGTTSCKPPFHERVWFRNVFDEAVGIQPQCEDPSAPFVPRATQCFVLPVEQVASCRDEQPSAASRIPGMPLLVGLLAAIGAMI